MPYTQKTGQGVYVPLPPVVEESLAKSANGELLFWSGHGNPKSAVADRIAEKHYAPWVRSRQIALEDAVRKSWS